MAQRTREELLAAFPDIASLMDKVERTAPATRTGQIGQRRPSTPKTTKRVGGRKGYKSYTTVDWAGVARNRKNYSSLDMGRVVESSGRNRRS